MGKNGYIRPTYVLTAYVSYKPQPRIDLAKQARQWRERVELSDKLK